MRLRVFPNTGHQFFHLPLAELLPDRDEDFLEQLTRRNRDSWKTWQGTPWMLYQYAIVDEKPILKVAIETNLGLSSRGLLFDYEDEPVSEKPDEDDLLDVYAAPEEARIENEYKHRCIKLKTLPNKESLPLDIDLQIFWVKRGGWDPVDVDLIVDLGNTRSLALLLESPGQELAHQAFGKRICILRFLPRGTPYDQAQGVSEGGVLADDCAIIDSWLLLHRPTFYHLEPPATSDKLSRHYRPINEVSGEPLRYQVQHYLPHTFVELSPALIGGGRSHPEGVNKTLAGVPLDKDARFTLSSPKRYAWDDEPRGRRGGTFWKQIPNDTDEKPPDYFDEFKSLIRFFMEPSGVDWDIDASPTRNEDFLRTPSINAEAEYPRRDAICWFALSILEAAHRQMNSNNYLVKMGRDSLPRRLRSVRVTYPAGWIDEEKQRYLDQWQRAINLFTLTRFENHAPIHPNDSSRGGSRPQLMNDGMDEAVCSQLPVLFADVKALGGPQPWVELYGKNGGVNVMNVDIGGGTTDIAIIRYGLVNSDVQAIPAKTLKTRLLFRDGYTVAGDTLVKRLIERALLPTWLASSAAEQFKELPQARVWIERFFKDPGHAEFSPVDPRASVRLMRITRLVFIPLVNRWLQQLGAIDSNPERSWESLNIGEMLRRELIDPNALNDLNALIDKLVRVKCADSDLWQGPAFAVEGVQLHTPIDTINESIDGVFKEHFDTLGNLAGRFDCDLVMVSGKPSELPRIRTLIADSFPLLPQRIIHVKNFPAGSWYPFSSFDEGRIADAKTCTVVGAALFQDMCNGACDALNLVPETAMEISRRYYWNIVKAQGSTADFHREYMFQPADYPEPPAAAKSLRTEVRTFELPANCRIGRQLERMPNVRAEPVYELRWTPSNVQPNPDARIRVKLRWESALGRGERLVCEGIEPHPEFGEVLPEDVEFRLNTLFEEAYWLDEPSFLIAE